MMVKKVEFYKHSLDESDINRAVEVLRSVFLTTGKTVKEFEESLSVYLEVKNAVGITSCTAALHLCLKAWNIGPGDEVITTPMSFCATSNSVMLAGAEPVFVDVEEDTGNIDASLIEKKITKKTKAIMPVHLYGQMCDMKKIREIADKYDLVVIEDSAHCLEGIRDGARPGQLGDAACFSFYATKNITSGEGGAIALNNKDKADLLGILRSHGIDKAAADRYTKLYQHWDMTELGWKYNMDNIKAALLIGQLQRADSLLEGREEVCTLYEKGLSGVKGIRLMKKLPGSKHARHLFTFQVDPEIRDSVLMALQKRGVGVAVNYRAVHLLKYYRERFGYKEGDYPVAERIGASTITIPMYPKLELEEIEYVIESVIEEVKKSK
ncbi:DegT/DnrJ/EryC1/StrS family aminotransferase [Candidatus Auribacterota bacterium]